MTTVLFWVVSLCALAGALTVVFTRDLLRLGIGLGLFFSACAAYFAVFGFGFLALAELFVYVGGVLVLVLFAIMLLPRSPGGRALTSRVDSLAAVSCVSLFALLVMVLRPLAPSMPGAGSASVEALADELLGPWLAQFELAGLLLLAALVAVVSITGGDRE